MENAIILQVKNLPYKKIPGYLKSKKINPELVAKSISLSESKYELINWKNYLPFDHQVIKVVLLKFDNLFLFVGHSYNDKSIIYNDSFSEMVLNQTISTKTNQTILPKKESLSNNDNKIVRINILLDKIAQNDDGIKSLTKEEKKELDELSNKLKH